MHTSLSETVVRPNQLKCVLAFSLILILTIVAREASALGPDAYGYVANSITVNFEDISGVGYSPTAILNNTNDSSVTVPIGFNFVYYGMVYNTVSISTNGLLSFQQQDTEATNVDISTTSPLVNVPMICVFWHDWTFQYLGSDQGYYQTVGTPGDRRFIMQWAYAQSYTGPGTDTVNFEVKLFEGSNNIEFHYDDATVSDDNQNSNGRNATVGIRDTSGQTNGRNLEWSYNKAQISDDSAIQFVAPPFKIVSITRLSNGHMLLQCLGVPNVTNKILATTDIRTGFTLLGSATASSSGSFQFEDTTAASFPKRFYKISYP